MIVVESRVFLKGGAPYDSMFACLVYYAHFERPLTAKVANLNLQPRVFQPKALVVCPEQERRGTLYMPPCPHHGKPLVVRSERLQMVHEVKCCRSKGGRRNPMAKQCPLVHRRAKEAGFL